MEDPFTRMSQNFFSFLSQIKQRGYVIATTQALSFSFFPPFSTTLVCVCSTVLLEFPNHPQEFPNLPTPMTASCSYMFISLTLNLECTKGLQSLHFNVQGKGLACTITDFTAPHKVFRENYLKATRSVVLVKVQH